MRWLTRKLFRDSLIVASIATVLLTVINFLFVYYSPQIIKTLPVKVVGSISPCYRTLFHHDGKSLDSVNFIFGDSFSEGMGDEFLSSDPDYGIFNKLPDNFTSELIFGRSGHGNIGTVVEFRQCYPLLSSYTSLKTQIISDYRVTFVFYEGNDLNNNLKEKDRSANETQYKLRFFLPVFEYIFREIRHGLASLHRALYGQTSSFPPVDPFPISSSGIQIGTYPQSAATELSNIEINESLLILFSSMDLIREILPDARSFMVLYIPSVASSYAIKGDMNVQSYNGLQFFKTTGEFNSHRSSYINNLVKFEGKKKCWYVCDTTSNILQKTNKGEAVHGPKDWKHFNKAGYATVAETYEKCLRYVRPNQCDDFSAN